MSPKQLFEFIQEVKAKIDGVNSAWVVVDDSQLGNTLERKSREDNAYLIGVLPSYGTEAHSGSHRHRTIGQLLIVEKTDYSDLTQEQFIDIFERTFLFAQEVVRIMSEMAESGCYPQFFHLDLDSIHISPIWKKSQCNGWAVDFEC